MKCEDKREKGTFRKNKRKNKCEKRIYIWKKEKVNADMTEIGTHAGLSQYSKDSTSLAPEARF